jgi:hypothetical protein
LYVRESTGYPYFIKGKAPILVLSLRADLLEEGDDWLHHLANQFAPHDVSILAIVRPESSGAWFMVNDKGVAMLISHMGEYKVEVENPQTGRSEHLEPVKN